MMEEFPASWVLLPVSEAVRNVTLTDKKIPQKNYLPSGKFPVFDQGQDNVGGYTDDAAMVIDCELPAIVFGDHTRVVKLVNTAFAPGADGVKVLEPSACISPKLLEHFVRYLVTKIPNNGYARHYQHLAKSLLPIPPIAEQHRIVAKIEELFSELDQGVVSLKSAREQLKVYRQSLLKNAFEGKLTAAWRTAHRDQLETATALQQRIARERQARYQQQLADWQTAGQSGPKPTPPKTLPPLTAEELAELPELPAGWGWVRVGQIADVQLGRQRSPNNRSNQFPVKYIRAGNLTDDGLNLSDVLDMDFEPEERERFLLKYGDVLLSEASGSAHQVGKPAVWRGEIEECCFQNTVLRVRSLSELSEYLFWVFKACYVTGAFAKLSGGVGINHLSAGKLNGMAMPLVGDEESKVVVQLINEKLSLIENLDQTLATTLQQADALRQSILKKAFHGQLVKQAKNEESASALLERIRAKRATSPTKGRQAKMVSKSLTNC